MRQKNIAEIAASYQQLKQFDKLTRVCLLDAYKNYLNYKANQLTPQDFDGSVKIWSLPMIEKLKSIYYKGLASLRKKQVNVKEH
ncbi:hypothetical protein TUA1478L_11910 [Lactiplantibacillus plantarum]